MNRQTSRGRELNIISLHKRFRPPMACSNGLYVRYADTARQTYEQTERQQEEDTYHHNRSDSLRYPFSSTLNHHQRLYSSSLLMYRVHVGKMGLARRHRLLYYNA